MTLQIQKIREVCAEIIESPNNHWTEIKRTRLAKALMVAVDALEKITTTGEASLDISGFMEDEALEALTQIASQLTGNE